MNRLTKIRLKTTCLALLMAMTGSIAQAQLSDVTQPGDTIVATSDNSPGSEGVTNLMTDPTVILQRSFWKVHMTVLISWK